MRTLRKILGLIFAVMASYAAIRGILLIVPALADSGGKTSGNPGLFGSGAVYLGISMEGVAIILGMLAYACFRSHRTPPRQPTEPES
ncbi:MAG: hypothetical protein AMJ54_05095 [Deltaproteobacteria bacterium SG8_13]|nr:MAG: hypothetical protein AMJ54_05095 [Deltaproteobacteria bacterium SG8_13]